MKVTSLCSPASAASTVCMCLQGPLQLAQKNSTACVDQTARIYEYIVEMLDQVLQHCMHACISCSFAKHSGMFSCWISCVSEDKDMLAVCCDLIAAAAAGWIAMAPCTHLAASTQGFIKLRSACNGSQGVSHGDVSSLPGGPVVPMGDTVTVTAWQNRRCGCKGDWLVL